MYGVDKSVVILSRLGVLVGNAVGSAVGRAMLELIGRVGDGTVRLEAAGLSHAVYSHVNANVRHYMVEGL